MIILLLPIQLKHFFFAPHSNMPIPPKYPLQQILNKLTKSDSLNQRLNSLSTSVNARFTKV